VELASARLRLIASARDVKRLASGAVVDLVPARRAVGDDKRGRIGLPHRWQQRQLGHLDRGIIGVSTMFIIDIHGAPGFATVSSSSRTPGEPYCGSCTARLNEIIFTRIDALRSCGRNRTWQFARIDLDLLIAAPDRHTNAKAF
jgi:hypothetical protein